MEKNKLWVELNNRSFDKDVIYVAIALRGGYVTKHYLLDGNRQFDGNLAFFNILFHYVEKNPQAVGCHFDVQRATASVSFETKREKVADKLNAVFRLLFSLEDNEEAFIEARQTARDAFAARYRDGAFRARNKAYEFSDLRKRFTLKSLIEDIEQIDYDRFKACAEALLVPGNACVYMSGETEQIDFERIVLPNMSEPSNHTVQIAGYSYDGFLRQEASIINVARKDHYLVIEALDFFNPEATGFTKQFITELLGEMAEQRDIDVWVDALDSSIILVSDTLKSYKERLAISDEVAYLKAKERLLLRYAAMSEHRPEHFALKAASLLTVGIHIDQYLSFINQCTFEMFLEIAQKADFKITEAQIMLRGE